MRGIKSHAMVLAASNSDHTEVSIYPSVFYNHVGSGTGLFMVMKGSLFVDAILFREAVDQQTTNFAVMFPINFNFSMSI